MVGRGALREYVRGSLWVLPGLLVLAAQAAGAALSSVRVGSRSPLTIADEDQPPASVRRMAAAGPGQRSHSAPARLALALLRELSRLSVPCYTMLALASRL